MVNGVHLNINLTTDISTRYSHAHRAITESRLLIVSPMRIAEIQIGLHIFSFNLELILKLASLSVINLCKCENNIFHLILVCDTTGAKYKLLYSTCLINFPIYMLYF